MALAHHFREVFGAESDGKVLRLELFLDAVHDRTAHNETRHLREYTALLSRVLTGGG